MIEDSELIYSKMAARQLGLTLSEFQLNYDVRKVDGKWYHVPNREYERRMEIQRQKDEAMYWG